MSEVIGKIETATGAIFEVLHYSEHYVMCKAPLTPSRLAYQALLDLDSMAALGYFVALNTSSTLIFEKRAK